MWNSLRQSDDYRSFLQAYLKERAIRLSDLARATGFGRGFPGQVISGQRRLTAHSLHAFEKALKLPPPGKKYFRMLVAREERDLFPGWKLETIEKTLRALRARDWSMVRRDLSEGENRAFPEVLRNRNSLAVYAAAGTPGHSVSHETLLARTGLAESDLKLALRVLLRSRLIEEKEGAYTPLDFHVALKSEGSTSGLLPLFQSAAAHSASRAETAIQSANELFFTSSFCLDEARLPELKAALRATLLRFVDDAIDADGNRVVHLTTGFHL